MLPEDLSLCVDVYTLFMITYCGVKRVSVTRSSGPLAIVAMTKSWRELNRVLIPLCVSRFEESTSSILSSKLYRLSLAYPCILTLLYVHVIVPAYHLPAGVTKGSSFLVHYRTNARDAVT